MHADQKAELSILHQQWLQHPCTKHLVAALKANREDRVQSVARHAIDIAVPEFGIRAEAYSIITVDRIVEAMTDLESFNNLKTQ